MSLTTSQIFQIGGVVVSALTGAASLFAAYGLSSNTVAAIVGTISLLGVIWNGVGTILTGPQSQAQAVAANIDNPLVKATVVPAVANLKGLNPLEINADADATLKKLANSNAPENQKIT